MYSLNMHKEHINLTQADYNYLASLVAKGQLAARVFKRATDLLEMHRGKMLRAVAETLHVSHQAVANWRDYYLAFGLQSLHGKPRCGRPIVIHGRGAPPYIARMERIHNLQACGVFTFTLEPLS